MGATLAIYSTCQTQGITHSRATRVCCSKCEMRISQVHAHQMHLLDYNRVRFVCEARMCFTLPLTGTVTGRHHTIWAA